MKFINIKSAYLVGDYIAEINGACFCSDDERSPLLESDIKILEKYSKKLLSYIQMLELGYTLHHLEKIFMPAIREKGVTYEKIGGLWNAFNHALDYELTLVGCILIPATRAKYFNEDVILNGSVLSVFPEIAYEIEEAQKCFALSRYTAAVFHLMRILEAGLKFFASKFNVNTENWQHIIDQIASAVNKMNSQSHGDDWKDKQQKYSEVCTHFRFLKNAWRNHTMHLKEQYDEDRAKRIMDSVAEFMLDLSRIV